MRAPSRSRHACMSVALDAPAGARTSSFRYCAFSSPSRSRPDPCVNPTHACSYGLHGDMVRQSADSSRRQGMASVNRRHGGSENPLPEFEPMAYGLRSPARYLAGDPDRWVVFPILRDREAGRLDRPSLGRSLRVRGGRRRRVPRRVRCLRRLREGTRGTARRGHRRHAHAVDR